MAIAAGLRQRQIDVLTVTDPVCHPLPRLATKSARHFLRHQPAESAAFPEEKHRCDESYSGSFGGCLAASRSRLGVPRCRFTLVAQLACGPEQSLGHQIEVAVIAHSLIIVAE